MRTIRTMLARISGLWRHHSGADDFSAELQSHLDMHIADNLRAGMTPDEVRRRAVIALGGVQQTKERYREARGVHWIDELRQDLRCAARTLVRNPGFAAPVIVTLALGIGANAAVFAVTYGILMRPLPYRDPSELVVLNLLFRDGGDLGFYPPTVASRLERLERVGDAAAYNVRDVTE